jgi:hypothetical protein
MKKRFLTALIVYSVWTGFWILVTVVPIGDGGAPAHLWLTITGFPLAFLSWYLPHGSIQAVVAAGVIGAVQLLALIAFFGRRARPTRERAG